MSDRRVAILIGIPTCRRPARLRTLLESLAAQVGVEEHQVEIMIADNDPFEHEGVRLAALSEKNFRWPITSRIVSERGISAVRNILLEEALDREVDFLVMIDDDETAEPQWLFELVREERATGADVIGGPVLNRFEAPAAEATKAAFPLRRRKSGPVDCLDATGNVLIACDALRRAGLPRFDDRFGLTGGGDKEFFVRLRQHGLRFAWADGAIAWEAITAERLQLPWILRRAFRTGNSDMRITHLHEGRKATITSLAKAVAVLLSSPLFVPALAFPG